MTRLKVAVLRGGPSHTYDTSLETGRHVLSLLHQMDARYEPIDIFISKDKLWHRDGLVREPHHAIADADAVWNALHGTYGEDGQVQKILAELGKPHTGSGVEPASRVMDKEEMKRLFLEHSLLTPRHEVLGEDSLTDARLVAIFRTYLFPVVVKPVSGRASLGIKIAHGFHDLKEAVQHALRFSDRVVIEEFIRGREASCSVIDEARGEKHYALVPLPSVGVNVHKVIEEMARKAHRVLGLSHYSRSDFVITPRGKVYILEANALPEFHQDSHLHQSLHAVGWHPRDFVHHVVQLAIK